MNLKAKLILHVKDGMHMSYIEVKLLLELLYKDLLCYTLSMSSCFCFHPFHLKQLWFVFCSSSRRRRSQVPVGTANAVYDSSLDDSEDATTVRDRQPQVNGLTFENTLYAELHTEEIGKSHA